MSNCTHRRPRLSRPPQALRALVLLAFLVCAIVSSMGAMGSHGLAVLTAMQHERDCCTAPHDHADDGHGAASAVHAADSAHQHHNAADHTHDKAHAVPSPFAVIALPASGWSRAGRAWVELIAASRLDRPPMA